MSSRTSRLTGGFGQADRFGKGGARHAWRAAQLAYQGHAIDLLE